MRASGCLCVYVSVHECVCARVLEGVCVNVHLRVCVCSHEEQLEQEKE